MVGDVTRKEDVVSSLPQPLEHWCLESLVQEQEMEMGLCIYAPSAFLPKHQRAVHVLSLSLSSLPPACQAHGLSSPEKGGILMQEAALDGCSPPLNQSLITRLLKCVRGLGRESESDREASLGGGTWF